jgi:hypothetical protein
VCTDENVDAAVDAAGGSCSATASAWAAGALLNTGNVFCVDSEGNGTTTSATVAATEVADEVCDGDGT